MLKLTGHLVELQAILEHAPGAELPTAPSVGVTAPTTPAGRLGWAVARHCLRIVLPAYHELPVWLVWTGLRAAGRHLTRRPVPPAWNDHRDGATR